ncbi:Tyrosine recombinase XerC [Symmachiella dynata]|uniref:Tyrosine recombinase XerC n=1 Tax=Symmachiella dynata TaxID=2527995 RepID=A0A517ZRU1_9PLAN|nr:Tyrosine recombinase XerC [Symmachiella dynata]
MASIYKRSKGKHEPYTIQYRDHLGKRRTKKGFTDKGLTEQLAAKLESEARLRQTGMIDPQQERYAEQKQSEISDHLAAFEESLSENTPKYVKLTMGRIRRIVVGCGFANLGDIDTEAVQAHLRSLRREENLGNRTFNHYLQAMDAFLNWCVSTKRLLVNPLIGMKRLNQEVDVRRKRRALTAEEIGRLIAAARNSGVSVQRFNGEQRARIYTLSYMTGLRKKELASLSVRSFHFDAVPPTVTVEAGCSKHRRKDVLPLHPDLVGMLREWLKGIPPGEKLFPNLDRKKTWFMVQKDLERVGIPYETEDGVADFHAAGRHTHITELLRNGATLPEAKALARHSDVKMTMRYTHIGIADQAKAVANLPAPQQPVKPSVPKEQPDEPALHGRCISGGVGCHSEARDGKTKTGPKSETPCGDRGLGVDRRHLSKGGKVEAAGIEPASCDTSVKASTCVFY